MQRSLQCGFYIQQSCYLTTMPSASTRSVQSNYIIRVASAVALGTHFIPVHTKEETEVVSHKAFFISTMRSHWVPRWSDFG